MFLGISGLSRRTGYSRSQLYSWLDAHVIIPSDYLEIKDGKLVPLFCETSVAIVQSVARGRRRQRRTLMLEGAT